MHIKQLNADQVSPLAEQFAEILQETVKRDGAVGFVMPLSKDDAAAFWVDTIAPQVRAGDRLLYGAFIGDDLVGTVQLIVGMPNNQRHRSEIAKLMVHPNHRRKGIARALLIEAEKTAIRLGRTLITLDTRTGDGAEPLYLSLGFQVAGIIPNYAKDAVGEGYHGTTYMYKQVG
jgi:ribosomal protein S18 acetylase RimI-like enzyme